MYLEGELEKLPLDHEYVNNHIHTTYSFSPYSPSKALWMAFISGLSTAGIMDHDSVGGALEFIEAGQILQMPVTVGMECRVDMSATRLAGKRINNPDQKGTAYMAVHGIPHNRLERVSAFIRPYQEHRNRRNREMINNLNQIMGHYGMNISFERDVQPISMSHDGGSITERHILYALVLQMLNILGRGEKLIRFLKEELQIHLNNRLEEVRDDKVICKDLTTGELKEYPCDTVLLALGMTPLHDVVAELRRCAPETEVFIVGDALNVGNISTATNSGFQAAIHI